MRRKKSYDGELAEAPTGAAAGRQADEKSQLVTDKARLAAAAEERREQAVFLARCSRLAGGAPPPTRELEASKSLAEEGSQRTAAERRAEQAHLPERRAIRAPKTARNLELERSAHAGAIGRLLWRTRRPRPRPPPPPAPPPTRRRWSRSRTSGLTVDTAPPPRHRRARGRRRAVAGRRCARIQASTPPTRHWASSSAGRVPLEARARAPRGHPAAREGGAAEAGARRVLVPSGRPSAPSSAALQNVKTDVEKHHRLARQGPNRAPARRSPLTLIARLSPPPPLFRRRALSRRAPARRPLCTCHARPAADGSPLRETAGGRGAAPSRARVHSALE